MLKRERCFQLRSEITTATILKENKLGLVTKVHGAKLLTLDTCSSAINLSLKELNYTTTATTFNETGSLLAIANETIISIIDTKSKLCIGTIRTFEGKITLLMFVPNSKYLIAGSAHGRVVQYRYDGRMQLSRLCSFGYKTRSLKENYVSAFSFRGGLLASSGYGGEIIVLKLNSYAYRETFKTKSTKIVTLAFLSDSEIVSASIDGLITIHTLGGEKEPHYIDSPFSELHNLVLVPKTEYAIVCGNSNSIAIVDLKKAKILRANFMSFEKEVSDILLTQKGKLFVVLQNKEIQKILLPSQKDIRQDILNNTLYIAFERVEQNPMLVGTREHKRVEVMYEKLCAQAIEALANHDTKEAYKLLENFTNIEEKRADINAIFQSFEQYQRFIALYLEKKYTLAYGLVQKYTALKYTQQYKTMEEGFKEAYALAQKQMLLGRKDLAKDVLSPYITVLVKRPMIQLILQNNSDFLSFIQALNSEDFKTIDRLVHTNEIFAKLPTFTSLQEATQKNLKSIENTISTGNHLKATSDIKKLLHVSSIKEKLQSLYRCSMRLKSFNEYYKENNFIRCYEVLDKSQYLHEYELAILLEKHWSKLMNSCEEAALKGDIESIIKTLGEFIDVKTRVDKIGDLLRLAHHVKIKIYMAKRKIKLAEEFIYKYIDTFGQDSEILLIMRSFESGLKKKLALTANTEKRLPRDHWKTTMLASSQ